MQGRDFQDDSLLGINCKRDGGCLGCLNGGTLFTSCVSYKFKVCSLKDLTLTINFTAGLCNLTVDIYNHPHSHHHHNHHHHVNDDYGKVRVIT